MPTYEYVCTECGQDLEVVQSFSDAALTECPQCSGKLRKRYSPVGVVFKGSGFYKTDNRSGSGRGKPREETAAKAGEPSPGSGGTDSTGSDGAAGEATTAKPAVGKNGASKSGDKKSGGKKSPVTSA